MEKEQKEPKKRRYLNVDCIKANDPTMRCKNCVFFAPSECKGNRFGRCPRKHKVVFTEYGCQNEFLAK